MTVYLVGAGPGSPDLLTLRAAELLRRCDVVVFDRLVAPAILDMAPPWAERVDVGKHPGGGTSQEEINALLIDRGLRCECVVRLKGGDPYVFGRGAEEMSALHAAGIDAEVVPGVSSAIAAPAAAGVPLTTRFASSGFCVVTAHQDPAHDRALDWDRLARLGLTLVVLMGARRARQIAQRLMAAGMDPSTPVAVVTDATLPAQRDVRLALAELGLTPIANPSVIVIGAVAAHDLRTELSLALSTERNLR